MPSRMDEHPSCVAGGEKEQQAEGAGRKHKMGKLKREIKEAKIVEKMAVLGEPGKERGGGGEKQRKREK